MPPPVLPPPVLPPADEPQERFTLLVGQDAVNKVLPVALERTVIVLLGDEDEKLTFSLNVSSKQSGELTVQVVPANTVPDTTKLDNKTTDFFMIKPLKLWFVKF